MSCAGETDAEPAPIRDGLKSLESNGSLSIIIDDLKTMIEEIAYVKNFDPDSDEFVTDIPVQIICGELDEFIPPVLSYKVSRVFKEIFFQVIPFAGHYFPLDFPEETAGIINDFLEKISSLKGFRRPSYPLR